MLGKVNDSWTTDSGGAVKQFFVILHSSGRRGSRSIRAQRKESENKTRRPPDYLDSHQYLLLVRGEVVTLGQEDFSEGALSQLSLQDDVVSLNVLDDWKKRKEEEKEKSSF
ncbi:hypothetical protein EYF80_009155 [Liparis tanakae]|uniref:Uncharacterized protein n=1 Tax=Liparis tanakae TaxID=230148 RepID=A0A4Z2ISB3_9TELE|nr:hypothetical protein EYF80_009155 [Liparis tanakae]